MVMMCMNTKYIILNKDYVWIISDIVV
jgi:hypothetical protein